MPIIHPQPNDHGQPVIIQHPSKPTPPATWHDPGAVATFLPGGDAPSELNGVPFTPWTDHPTSVEGWNTCPGLLPELIEPVLKVPAGLKASAGAVVIEADGRVWTVHPTNRFGNYNCTLPKGRIEPGMTLQGAAVREVWEESGLKVELTGLLGDFARTTTVCRLYRARRVGGHPGTAGWESQAITLAPLAALPDLLDGLADQPVLAALIHALEKHPPARNGEIVTDGGGSEGR